jgi:molybdopterin converting factor subunit 1
MRWTIRLFARARDLAGADVVTIDLPDGSTVGDLRKALAGSYPALAGLLDRSAVAVQNSFAGEDLLLPSGAEIALLPPVSGGRYDSVDARTHRLLRPD